MTEKEKAEAGELYDANHDPELLALRMRAKSMLFALNHTPPDEENRRLSILGSLLGAMGSHPVIEGGFHCDYGFNIKLGDHVYANVNFVILDAARVTVGNNVYFGPNVGLYTSGHPIDVQRRNQGLEFAWPISIEDDVWIGAGVHVLPGVRIGRGSVVAAGSVVVKDVAPLTMVGGNPAKVIRQIGPEESSREYRRAGPTVP